MFIGALTKDLQAVVKGLASNWGQLPVYVGCSGNFTIERILSPRELHGNDVTLYSCCIGEYLTGRSLEFTIQDDGYRWLEEYMKDDLSRITTLLLCTTYFAYAERQERYYCRMAGAYEDNWESLHAETLERVSKALDGVKLASFYQGDVVDFINLAPKESLVVSFPLTYKGGYERIYKKFDQVFKWDSPKYALFDDDRFALLAQYAMGKSAWVLGRDQRIPEMEPHLRAIVQSGLRAKPIYFYAGDCHSALTLPRQKTEPVPYSRITSEDIQSLTLVKLSQPQMNLLRSEYLTKGILPSPAQVNLGVVYGDKLIGGLAFTRPIYSCGWCDCYMMTDFAVSPTIYKRLAKLVLIVALSKEVQAILQQMLNNKVATIGTTAFTNKPVSMKYRGIFDLRNRKEGALNYIGQAGQWNLAEGLEIWKEKHSQRK